MATKADGGRGNKAYEKGKRYERKARAILEAAGYYVIRSAGSKGLWDLVAVGPGGVRLIQVKVNSNASLAEREEIAALHVPINATKEIWRFTDHLRAGPSVSVVKS